MYWQTQKWGAAKLNKCEMLRDILLSLCIKCEWWSFKNGPFILKKASPKRLSIQQMLLVFHWSLITVKPGKDEHLQYIIYCKIMKSLTGKEKILKWRPAWRKRIKRKTQISVVSNGICCLGTYLFSIFQASKAGLCEALFTAPRSQIDLLMLTFIPLPWVTMSCDLTPSYRHCWLVASSSVHLCASLNHLVIYSLISP